MSIHFSRLGQHEEYFAWSDQNTGEVIHFATTRMNTYLSSHWPVTKVALTPQLVTTVIAQNGIELEHLERIDDARLNEPVIMLAWPDGTHVTADGSHRLVKRASLGLHFVPAFLAPERLWRRFVIDGMPGEEDAWRQHLAAAQPLLILK